MEGILIYLTRDSKKDILFVAVSVRIRFIQWLFGSFRLFLGIFLFDAFTLSDSKGIELLYAGWFELGKLVVLIFVSVSQKYGI